MPKFLKNKQIHFMKKTITFLFIIITMGLHAQIKYGVNIGLNNSKGRFENVVTNSNSSVKSNFGIKIGGFVEFKINSKLALQTGLNYDQKSGEIETTTNLGELDKTLPNSSLKIIGKFNPQYLEIPINLKYVVFSKLKNKLGIIGGLYVGYGIGGTKSVDISYINIPSAVKDLLPSGITSSNINFGNENSDLRPFDMGLNAGLDYNLNKIQLRVQYQLGFSNLVPQNEGTSNQSYKNSNINFSIGYFFN